jgi:hypothetical protein
MTSDGIDTEAIGRRVEARLADLVVPVIALGDLIANKRSAGRPQEIADVATLERVASAGRAK